MNHLKKLITILFLICAALLSGNAGSSKFSIGPHQIKKPPIIANDDQPNNSTVCGTGKYQTAFSYTLSKEDLSIPGSFNYLLVVKAQDTTYIDSIQFNDPGMFTLQMLGSFNKTYLLPGDSAVATIQAIYDTSAIPYYPQHYSTDVYTHVGDNTPAGTTNTTVIYFTPYNTTEIWDMGDFAQLPRRWEPYQSPEPQRIFIAKSKIPVSTRPALTDSLEEWEYNFSTWDTLGLPYAIEMKAPHPDSIAAWHIRDSIAGEDSTFAQGSSHGKWWEAPKYSGTVVINLSLRYKNFDYENIADHFLAKVPLSGIRLKLLEKDPWEMQTFDVGYTNNLGQYTLSYTNIPQSLEGGNIELYLEIDSEDPGSGISARRRSAVGFGAGSPIVLQLKLGDNFGKQVNITEDIVLDATTAGNPENGAFQALHYATNAYKFTRNAFNASEFPPTPSLHVLLYRNKKAAGNLGSHYNHSNSGNQPTIFLEPEDEHLEGVVYHEFGHHVMWTLQGTYNMTAADVGHSWEEQKAAGLTWTEGWGYGFEAMVDHYYRKEDKSYTITDPNADGEWEYCYAVKDVPTKWERLEWRSHNKFAQSQANRNGVKSEMFIACAIYDLYDGPLKFNDFPVPTQAAKYLDNGAGGYPATYTEGYDDVELTFRLVAEVMLEYRTASKPFIYDVGDYFRALVGKAIERGDCAIIPQLQHIFDENRISKDIDPLDYKNTGLASGYVGDHVTYLNLLQTLIIDHKKPIISVNEQYDINTSDGVANKWISSPLTIQTGGSLNLNINTANIMTTPIVSDINIEGTLKLGGTNSSTIADLKCGAKITIKNGGKLVLNNNSKLNVKNGSSIVFESGASVELNNDNSAIVFEDGSKLSLAANATFTFTGNGYLRFVNSSQTPNIEALGTNAKFQLSGNGETDKILELAGTEGIYTNTSLSLCKIENGKILAEPDSRLNIYGTLTMNSILMDKLVSNANKHKGILTHGQSGVTLNRVTVKNGETGFSAVSNGINRNIVTITCGGFKNCTQGVYSYNVPLSISHSEISGNTNEGWVMGGVGSMTESLIHNTVVKDNGTDGVRFDMGSSGIDLKITNSTFSNNGRYVNGRGVYKKSGNLTVKCTYFTNNGTGIYAENLSIFDIGSPTNPPTNYGKNYFITNTNSAIEVQNVPSFTMAGARNRFTINSGQKALTGNLGSFCYGTNPATYDVSNNYWTNTPNSSIFNLTYFCSPFYINYNINTTPTLAISGWAAIECGTISNPCGGIIQLVSNEHNNDNEITPKQSVAISKTGNPQLSSAWDIELSGAKDTVFSGKVKSLCDSMQTDSLPNKTINSLSKLLRSRKEKEIKEDKKVVDFAYMKLMEGVGKVFDYYSHNKLDSTVFTSIISATDNTQKYLLEKTAKLETSYSDSFRYSIDNVILQRDAGNRTEALYQLSEILKWAHKDDVPDINMWECWINREIDIANGYLSVDNIKHWDSCEAAKSASEKIIELGFERKLDKQVLKPFINIYPNPANDIINIEIVNESKGLMQISMYDITGRLVYTSTSQAENINSTKVNKTIATKDFTPGMYMVHITSGDMGYKEKVLIIK